MGVAARVYGYTLVMSRHVSYIDVERPTDPEAGTAEHKTTNEREYTCQCSMQSHRRVSATVAQQFSIAADAPRATDSVAVVDRPP